MPFVRPADPGTFNLPPFTSTSDAFTIKAQHDDAKKVWKECIGVEKTLKKQLVAALEDIYINQFRNGATNIICTNIPDILGHLFHSYGTVTSDKLTEEEDKVKAYFWQPHDPPDIIFNLLSDLAHASIAAGLAKTNEQIINYGLDLIKKTGEYERAILEWYNKLPRDQTWIQFKIHFCEGQALLRCVRGSTMRNTPFHQANAALRQDMEIMRDNIVGSLNAMASVVEESQVPSATPTTPSLNATQQQQYTNLTLLQALQDMKLEFTQAVKHMNSMNNNTTNNNGGGGRYCYCRNTNRYCWTHGACNHHGRDCRHPGEGRKQQATFNNRIGGSDKYCRKTGNDDGNN